MKLRVSAAVLVGISLTLGLTSVVGQQGPPPEDFIPGEAIVQFDRNVGAQARAGIVAQRGATTLKKYEALDIEHVRLAPGRAVADAVNDFLGSSGVVAASPNYIRRKTQQVPPPNDPFWLSGQLYGLVRISAQPAWNQFGGGNGTVVIANIDTGVDYNHPDLNANAWVNPGEIAGNLIDDDNNGYIDDVRGIDAVNNDSNPIDDEGHGTHTAGTSAGVGNNGIGITGVIQNAKILTCKFLDANGNGSDSNAIECFNYIVFLKTQRSINIRVSSNSWGGGGNNPAMSNAINAAGNAGIINIFAAGNGGADQIGDNNDITPFYPASFPLPSIISVASSNQSDNRSGFSNFGVVSVDLAAPGSNIISAQFPGTGYVSFSGTSMATPHVAGAAAFLAGLDPNLSVDSIKQALLSTVDVLPQWQGVVLTGGRLNLLAAAQAVGGGGGNPTAVFLGTDSATQGDWPEGYGADGHVIVADQTDLPSYAQLTPSGHQEFVWTPSTSDPRALLRASGPGRLAATWYSGTSFDIDVNITDGNTHRVALYMVDWDTTTRSQRIDVLNAANSQILDTRTVNNFSGGQYLVWNISGHVKFRVTRLAGPNSIISGVFFGDSNLPPIVALTSPLPGANFNVGQTVPLAANASDPDGTVASVAFFSNGNLLNTDMTAPYSFNWTTAPAGPHSLTAVATDNLGLQTTSAPVNITVGGGGGGPTATFVGSDAATQGDWPEAYGDDGYVIVGDQTSLPAYATVNPIGNLSWTFDANSSDPRALLRVGGGRVAATWYAATSFDVDVTITGGTPRQVSLYMVDFDFGGRSQRVDVLNAATLAVLDTRTINNFTGGQYFVWNVQGAVKFRVTRLTGPNAVLNGLFFGPGNPPPPPTAVVTFIGNDGATQGNWPGAYGADGHVIVSDTTSLPGYAQVAPIGQLSYVWDPAPSDVRALQRSGGGRVAATWYGETFDVDVNLSGGQPHEVALYFVDYDTTTRSQRIDVLDAGTSAVLDTRTLNNFSGGQYLVWNVTGHVRIRVTRLAGPNAVVSGVFLAPPNAPAPEAEDNRR